MGVFPTDEEIRDQAAQTEKVSVGREWSKQQTDVFKWFERDKEYFTTEGIDGVIQYVFIDVDGNLVVRARAGTGKTTTIIEGVNRAPEQSIILCAFNKRIADELNIRITNPAAQAKTLHALGFAFVRRNWPGINVAYGSIRADALADQVCGPSVPEQLRRLVGKLHTKGREIEPFADVQQLMDLAIDFDLEPDEQWRVCDKCRAWDRQRCKEIGKCSEYGGYDTRTVAEWAHEAMEAATVRPDEGIDFADMIYLPIRNRWLRPMYDLGVCDETQDMNKAQLIIMRGVVRGRICIVGDDRQAIYGWRGADSESVDRLKAELNAGELGLTTTYRCGKAIVALAKKFVPDFECGADNSDGIIRRIKASDLVIQANHGDFILSRVNAPIVGIALDLLTNGKRARVAGRDIGAGLKVIIRKIKARSVPEFLEGLAGWSEREIKRLKAANRGDKAGIVTDQAETLIALARVAQNVNDIEAKIDMLFTDDGLGAQGIVTCSSVHRAKGLESSRVFLLEWTFRSGAGNIEEDNLRYVAITRARHELIWVSEG